jgi:membrane fusion protein, heavy metal efflux system
MSDDPYSRAPQKPMPGRFLHGLLCVFLLALALTACGRGATPRHEADEPPTATRLHFSDRTELFAEHPYLVQGAAAKFAVHLTRLDTFRPVAAGRVRVLLTGAGGEVAGVADAPSVPGIYGPAITPLHAGEHRLAVVLEGEGEPDRHELGVVTVYATHVEAARAHGAAAAPSEPTVRFLKEQQWGGDFATESVGERPLRASILVYGVVRPRTGGDAVVRAPSAGRLIPQEGTFPPPGAVVTADQALAAIAPRVGGDIDAASLDLDLAQADAALRFARREREREESLVARNLTTEREASLARREESDAEARLRSAQSRRSQFFGTQRAGGVGAGSRLLVRAPFAGQIASVEAAPGSYVEKGDALFRVVDPSRLWLELRVPEADLPRVERPTGASFVVEGAEGETQLGPEALVSAGLPVDPATRTSPVLFELAGAAPGVRSNASVRARLFAGAPVTSLAVPAAALVDEDGQLVAYVQVDGEAFARRPIRAGLRDGGHVQVLDGLRAGERVVTRGAYAVRRAGASTSLPAHGHAH